MKKQTAPKKPEQPRMPRRLPDDHQNVTALLDESERCSTHAMRWHCAKVPNHIAAQKAAEMGWAYALAAAFLRCHLNGELVTSEPSK
jgi:hypothetical protein